MRLGMTVVTHTCPKWGRDISRCVNSVNAALPANAKHVVLEIGDDPADFIEQRYRALSFDDVIVFVDDDDYISQDSLSLCLDALEESGAGIAFTSEIIVHPGGIETHRHRDNIQYDLISQSPIVIHHMTAIRSSAVSDRSINLARKHAVGTEWIMKSEAALFHGAIHVPTLGYYWCHHDNQYHKSYEINIKYIEKRELISNEIKKWGGFHHGVIPTYNDAKAMQYQCTNCIE
jgi:glycosyltransferase involved in cell wall biosynthesis